MKIRLRLTLWYMAVSMLIMLVFSAILYFGMKHLLYQALDDDINIFADTIEQSYNPFLGEFEELLFKLESANRYKELYLIVFSRSGQPIFATPMTQYLQLNIPLPKNKRQQGLTVTAPVTNKSLRYRNKKVDKITFRAISRRLYYRDHPIGWMQAALPIQQIEDELHELLQVMLAANIIAVALIGLGGFFLTKKSLRPLRTIISTAQDISERNLEERIPVLQPNDEIGQLTATLNSLLGRLSDAFSAQRNFISDIAHELKTPLAIMRSHWESELNNPDFPENAKTRVITDVESISRMNRLLDDLSQLNKTESRQAYHFEYLKVGDILKAVREEIYPLAELKEQELQLSINCDRQIFGDRVKLHRLFFNLIENAIKYTPDEGHVKVDIQCAEASVDVTIRDTGPGVPAEDLPHIFERFYRVQKDRSRKTGGSGLGLAICKMIADGHQAKINAYPGENKGMVFHVSFPKSRGVETLTK